MVERQLDLLKGPRQRGRKAPLAPERDTHIAIADTIRRFKKADWWASHIPSGELRTEATGALLKRMGLTSGMADFMLLGPGVICFLEIKRPPNKPTEAQIVFGDAAKASLALYAVAYSYKEAVEILTGWGCLRRNIDAS